MTMRPITVQSAQEFYKQGKFELAEQYFLALNESQPNNSAFLEYLGCLALWKNHTQRAEQYFLQAKECLPIYKNIWPLTAQLNTRLGMTYYRQDRFAEAARQFKQAAGPFPIGPFAGVNNLAKHFSMFKNQATYVIEGPLESSIDFIFTDPGPLLQVSINDSPPYCFLLDTGGSEILIDSHVVKTLELETNGVMHAGGNKGVSGDLVLGKVRNIRIGEMNIHNLPFYGVDISTFSSEFDNKVDIHGVIGTRVLMHFLSTIDYKNGRLILRQVNEASNCEVAYQSQAKFIPFWQIDTHFILAKGTLNGGEPMVFFVDTGLAGKAFTAPESVLNGAGISIDWSQCKEGPILFDKVKETDINIDKLTLGEGENEVVVHDLIGVAMDKPPRLLGNLLGIQIDGLISHAFFRNYALTFDFVNMQMVLE
ncbi:aspartyl protease family protein [Kaarinaea lacus]